MGPTEPTHPEMVGVRAELLDRAAPGTDPESASRPARALVVVAALAAVVAGVLMTIRTGQPVETGRLHLVEARFGDPFDVEWFAIDDDGEGATVPIGSAATPRPMASLDPPCIGFGRPEWPEDRRQPTVAHCADPAALTPLSSGDVALVRAVLAGDRTWHLLRFGRDPADVTIDLDLGTGTEQGAGTTAGVGGRVTWSGPYAAVVLPTGPGPYRLGWTETGGRRYRCTIDLAGPAPPSC